MTTFSYQWTNIECELCQTRFPDTILASDGKKYKIFEFKEPEEDNSPFIVFQSVYTTKKVKTIHVVTINKKKSTKIVSILRIFKSIGESL